MIDYFARIEIIARLLVRRRIQAITDPELAELEKWTDSSPVYGELARKWTESDYLARDFREFAATDVTGPLSQIKQAIENDLREVCLSGRPGSIQKGYGREESIQKKSLRKETGRRESRPGIRVRTFVLTTAAALIIFLVYGLGLFGPGKNKPITIITEYSPTLLFEDGSRIELGNSTLVHDNGAVGIRRQDGASETLLPETDADNAAIPSLTLHIPRGHIYELALEDGTQVWMNAQSRLRYPASFDGVSREVELEGEAFFRVASDGLRPFRVTAGGQRIEVLGTEFNIRAYGEEEAVYTTLLDGSVEIITPLESLTLYPGNQSVLSGGALSVRPVNAANAARWREGVFIVEGEPLSRIMVTLARWYDFHVTYGDEALGDIVFNCVIPRYGEFGRILDLLERTDEVGFEVRGNRVTVKGKKSNRNI